jgi:hypothetical protein
MISRPRPLPLPLLFPLLLLLTLCALPLAPARAQMDDAGKNEEPAFKEFRGVSIGTPMDEARKKLGNPTDKGDTQDFYVFSDDETAQVFYDSGKKVSAVAVVYTGGKNAPTARAIFGKEVAPKPDGSQYLRIHYPKVNYWVSYSRTAGDTPVTSVMMQRK